MNGSQPDPPKEEKVKAQDVKKSSSNDVSIANNPPHPPAPAPPQPDAPHTPQPEKCPKASIAEWCLVVLEILALGGLIYYCYLNYGELETFRREAKTMEDEYKDNGKTLAILKRQLDDSEAQQRALLTIESIQIKRITNSGQIQVAGKYRVQFSMVLMNHGTTPAIDLRGGGKLIPSSIVRRYKELNITNGLQHWDGINPTPEPGYGGQSIMAQTKFTNTYEMGNWDFGDGFYIESWLNYRDIFGKEWIVGEGGSYDFTNDTFTPEFIKWPDYSRPNQAEFEKRMNTQPK